MQFAMKTFLGALALVLIFTGFAWAQTETGQITGTITDPSGAVVPKANVTVRLLSTGATRTTASDNAGFYGVTNLLPGDYLVTVEAQGLAKMERRVQVTVGSKNGLDFKLQISTSQTVVEVQGEGAATVNVETQTLTTELSNTEVMQLPTLNRNPYLLAVTAPGVSEDDPSGRGVGVTINGLRSAGTNVLLDGAANNDEFTAEVGQQVPLDSLQEFSIITNNFTAEYGRADAGVVNVATKSGTNALHGSAYEVGRWSALGSNGYYDNANLIPKPVYTRNLFGGSAGGPIKKDKMFFFFNPEWTRVRSNAPVTGAIVDPALIALLAANSRSFFSTYGVPRSGLTTLATYTLANSGMCTGPLCTALPSTTSAFDKVLWYAPGDSGGGLPQNTYDIVGRFDYNISSRTSFYSRYAIYNEIDQAGAVNTSPFVGYDTGQQERDQNMLLSLTHTISSNFTEQSKFVYNRLKTIQPLGANPVSPTLYFTTNQAAVTSQGDTIYLPGYSATTPGNAIPFGGPQNFFQVYEDLTYIHGKHEFRFGGSLNFLEDNRAFGAYEEAVEDLGGTDASVGMENLISGNLANFTAAIDPQGKFPCKDPAAPDPSCTINLPVTAPNFSRSNRYNEMAVYGMDAWKLNPHFTLNLGLRWEYFGVQHNVNPYLDSNFYYGGGGNVYQQIENGSAATTPTSPVGGLWGKDYRNFGPRLGFAWDVFGDDKTSVRGGYGIGYERNFGNVTFNIIQNPPNYAVVTLPGVQAGPITNSNYGPLSGTSGTAPLPVSQMRWVDPNIKNAYAHLYSLSLEHQFSPHMLAGIDYSGSRGENLYALTNYNMCGAGNVFLGIPVGGLDPSLDCSGAGLGWYRLNTQYANINKRTSDGKSLYNAAIFRLNFQNLGKTGLTMAANYTYSLAQDELDDTFSSSTNQWNVGYTDPFNPHLDWGPADFSNRHRVSLSAVWAVPFAKDTHGLVKQAFDGWTLSPIFTARSGAPFTIYDCTNASGLAYNQCPRVALNSAIPHGFHAPVADPSGAGDLYDVYTLPTAASGVVDESVVNPVLGVSDFGPWSPKMMGRNLLQGPGAWNMDLGIYKTFFVTEKYKLQFRTEMFNALNHANLNWIGYSSTVGGFEGPNILAQYGYDSRFSPAVIARRNIQMTLRLDF
jgi:outer membrane receptor protein involved in Fe transport